MACGLVNGLGSIGGVAQSFVLVAVTDAWGWEALFWLYVGLALFGAALLAPFRHVRPTVPTPAPG